MARDAARDAAVEDLKRAVRDVPDFPKKGIVFKDITTLLYDGRRFQKAVDLLAAPFTDAGVTKVAAVEARGFILGACLARVFGAGFVPVRKKGKLPYRCVEEHYTLEYGRDTLQMHEDAVNPDDTVLVVDDLLATGGTTEATLKLLRRLGPRIAGCAFLIELSFLKGRHRLGDCPAHAVITY